ncbi:MAG: hypothetical protein H0V17_28535 [Deltaproteobacteria bacterium]|nr:hypothetical protein [Deltaproteobacteria bacterium]
MSVPPHTEATVLAHPIPNRGGNPHVHDYHLFTREDHIDPNDVDSLDSQRRPWALLLYGSLAAMTFLLVWMIARS